MSKMRGGGPVKRRAVPKKGATWVVVSISRQPNNPTKDTSGLHNSIVVKTRNRKGESLREG